MRINERMNNKTNGKKMTNWKVAGIMLATFIFVFKVLSSLQKVFKIALNMDFELFNGYFKIENTICNIREKSTRRIGHFEINF